MKSIMGNHVTPNAVSRNLSNIETIIKKTILKNKQAWVINSSQAGRASVPMMNVAGGAHLSEGRGFYLRPVTSHLKPSARTLSPSQWAR